MKKFFKVIGIIFGGLIGLIIVVHIILNITFSIQLKNKIAELKAQGRPTTIAEIIPSPVPDEENAAILYNKAFAYGEGKLSDVINTIIKENIVSNRRGVNTFSDISEWTDKQREEIPKLVNSRDAQYIYQLLEEGSQRPKCNFNLEYEKGRDMQLSPLSEMRDSARLLCLKALLQAESGNVAQAFDTLIIGLKMANHLKDEPILISQLVRIGCDGIIIECIKNISDSKDIPVEKAKLIIDELSHHTDIEPFIKCMDGERVVFGMWTFETIIQGKIPARSTNERVLSKNPLVILLRPIFQKNYLCYLTLMSKIQDKYNLPYYEIAQELKNNSIDKQIGQLPKYCFLVKGLTPAFDRIRETAALYQANVEICRTGLTLKIYRVKNGVYPETLGFLSEFPIDPFSGKNLIYRKSADGFILYSLGPNMKDDGGISRVEKVAQLQRLQQPLELPEPPWGYSSTFKENPTYKDYDIVWECEK